MDDEESTILLNAVGVLSELLVLGQENDRDILVDLDMLRPILTVEVWEDVCLSVDICPQHVQDIEICLDDFDPNEGGLHCKWADMIIRAREWEKVKGEARRLEVEYIKWREEHPDA